MTKTFIVQTGEWEKDVRMVTDNFENAMKKAKFIEEDEIVTMVEIVTWENEKEVDRIVTYYF